MFGNITSDDFQKAFDLAFTLHPRKDVALRVTTDACDLLPQLEGVQNRRIRSVKHWKAAIPQEQLLQYAIYVVSYVRELDQESPRPRLEPKYTPSREDGIVRYVKHLIWKTSLLNIRNMAVGIGCLLYAYKPSDIADLVGFEEDSLRMIKMRLVRELGRRFENTGVLSPEGTFPATDNDRLIVEGVLKALTPWGTAHLETPTRDKPMLEILFDEKNPLSEWDCKHALIDPECGGLAQLIIEYNKVRSKSLVRLDLIDLALYRTLIEHPELMRTLDWRVFENLLADIIESFGYTVELQCGTKDGGVDIFAMRSDQFGQHRYMIQAKRWSNRVGIEPVRQLLFLHGHHHATKSCLATTSAFTHGAWDLAAQYRWQLELRDFEGIRDWLGKAYELKSGGNKR